MTVLRCALALACAATLFGCREQTPTQLVVVVDSDWDGFERLEIEVSGFEKPVNVKVKLSRKDAFPRRLVLVHDGGPPGPIAVTVRAFVAGKTEPALIEPRTDLFFEIGQVRLLKIDLPFLCLHQMCASDDACVAGPKCKPSDAASKLVPWTGDSHALDTAYHVGAGDVLDPEQPNTQDASQDAGPNVTPAADAARGADAAPAQDGASADATTPPSDAMIRADGGVLRELARFEYEPANFSPSAAELAESQRVAVKLDCQKPAFDSSRLMFENWCGPEPHAVVIAQPGGAGDVALLVLASFELASGSTLQLKGARPVILAAFGDVTIQGVIDASAHGAQAGPGADRECTGANGANGVAGSTTTTGGGSGNGGNTIVVGASGGGGGGYGSTGAAGGGETAAAGGLPVGAATLVPLRGGCSGGRGGAGQSSNSSAAGGGGGGAVQISAAGKLRIEGAVVAGGGGGGVAVVQYGGGGGGGGSGGAILLEAAELELAASAILSANGGGGGAGQARSFSTASGQAGEDARASSSPAAGGVAVGSGGLGGAGAMEGAVALAGNPGTGSSAISGGGGGGGGVGRVHVRPTTSCSVPGSFSPSPSVTCPSCGGCGPGADCRPLTNEDHTFYFCDQALSLQNARTRCQSAGLDLIEIRDSARNAWLTAQLRDETWIGASDAVQEGSWEWLHDGAVFWIGGTSGTVAVGAFANWASSEPNNYDVQGFGADCAAITTDGEWHDRECTGARAFVCE